MRRWAAQLVWSAVGAALAATLSIIGCSGEADDAQLSANTGSGGLGFGAGPASGGGGAAVVECTPACIAPQFCSVAGVCLEPGTCASNGDCSDPGTVCDPQTLQCVPGGECGAEAFPIERLPPNLMLVLDRTGSMEAEVAGSGGKSRWQVAHEAVDSVLADFGDTIRFGLVLFSACTAGGCAPGTTIEPIGSDPTTISQDIADTELCNSGDPETVIGGTLAALVGDASLQDAGRDNAILLLTDGEDNCDGGGAEAAAALLAQPIPVATYVVGFSSGVNVSELEGIAEAAGTSPYYHADDAAQLEAALQAIAASVASCSYTLSNPPDADLFVFFNDDPAGLANDPTDGWTFDSSTGTLTFHGAACEAIENGAVDDIDVVFGCNQLPPD